MALFFTRTYSHLLLPGLAQVYSLPDSLLGRCFLNLDREIDRLVQHAYLAA